jgi:tetratricopeptide (TPR) repeat protein
VLRHARKPSSLVALGRISLSFALFLLAVFLFPGVTFEASLHCVSGRGFHLRLAFPGGAIRKRSGSAPFHCRCFPKNRSLRADSLALSSPSRSCCARLSHFQYSFLFRSIYLAYRWHDRSALAAFAWLLFALAPVVFVSLFPSDDIVHDRYLYIPSIGAALFLAIALRTIVATPWVTPRSLLLPISAALSLMAGSTVVQSRPWKDDFSLYDHACSLSPNHATACNNLAVALIGRGDYLRARSILLAILQRDPNFALANANMGSVSYHLGDFPAAEQYLRRAISLDPVPSQPYVDLAMTCYRTNRIAEAASLLRQAIARKPDGEGYHLALGSILMEQNDFRDACNEFRTGFRLNPHLPAASTLLSQCEQRLSEPNHTEPNR